MSAIFKSGKLHTIEFIVFTVALAACIWSLAAYYNQHSTADFQSGVQASRSGMNAGHGPHTQRGPSTDATRDRSEPGKLADGGQISWPGSAAGLQLQGHTNGRKDGGQAPVRFTTKTEPALLAGYTAIFIALSVLVYRRYKGRDLSGLPPFPVSKGSVALLLGIGLLARIALAPWLPGHLGDMNYFRTWALAAAGGLKDFYSTSGSDYPPLLIYILYVIGKAAALPGMDVFFNTLIKLPSILADVLTTYVLYRLAAKWKPWIGFILGAFYLFNPAVLLDSTFWGQVDSLFTLLIVLTVLMITEGRLNMAALLLAAAVMLKPQGIIFTPVLFFEWVNQRSMKKAVKGVLIFLATSVLLILPFTTRENPAWIVDLFRHTIKEYPYASVNGYNLFSLLGANHKPNTSPFLFFNYSVWGFVFIVLTTLFSWIIYIRGNNARFAGLAALFQIAGVFTFSTSMHERYLFPAAALALAAYVYLRDNRLLWFTAGFSLTIFMNVFAVLYGATGATGTWTYNLALEFISFLNVAGVLALAVMMWRISGDKRKLPA